MHRRKLRSKHILEEKSLLVKPQKTFFMNPKIKFLLAWSTPQKHQILKIQMKKIFSKIFMENNWMFYWRHRLLDVQILLREVSLPIKQIKSQRFK
jgi:hypothetical protein